MVGFNQCDLPWLCVAVCGVNYQGLDAMVSQSLIFDYLGASMMV